MEKHNWIDSPGLDKWRDPRFRVDMGDVMNDRFSYMDPVLSRMRKDALGFYERLMASLEEYAAENPALGSVELTTFTDGPRTDHESCEMGFSHGYVIGGNPPAWSHVAGTYIIDLEGVRDLMRKREMDSYHAQFQFFRPS